MTDDEMIEKTRAGLRWVLADIEPGTRVHELTDEEVEDLARCRKSNAVMDNTVRELEADKALLREALGSAIRNIENLTADIEAHKECAECQNNIEMYVEATGIYRAALQETSHMTHDEMIEATKQALADTTNFDGDRLASHFSDSELDDIALAAIRVIAPAVLEDVAALMEGKGGVIPLGSYYARLVSGNSMPHPSGDDRNRIKYDFQRKEFDRVTENVAHAIRAMRTRYEQ